MVPDLKNNNWLNNENKVSFLHKIWSTFDDVASGDGKTQNPGGTVDCNGLRELSIAVSYFSCAIYLQRYLLGDWIGESASVAQRF